MPGPELTPAPDPLPLNVLVNDLLDRNVVAAIAKRGSFAIKDKENLTSETWKSFRNMIAHIQQSQAVDPDVLESKLR
ncbi:MAG: hypothetical protein Q9213_001756 [Squamulea squamosa]